MRILVVLGMLVCAAIQPALAQLVEKEEFRFFHSTEPMPEGSEVTSGVILTPAGRFVFLPPREWNFQAKPKEKTLIFLSPEPGLALIFRLNPGQTNAPAANAPEEWERLVRGENDHEGWEMSPRGVFWADGLIGTGFDLMRNTLGKPKFLKRLVFCPSPAGMVKFELAGHPDSVEKHQVLLAAVVGSLRFEPLARSADTLAPLPGQP